jgi:hypothetical protein
MRTSASIRVFVLCSAAALCAWPAAGLPAVIAEAAVAAAAAASPAATSSDAGGKSQLAAAEVAFSAGLVAFQEGRDDEALELFSQAARLDGDDGNFRYWRGLTLLRMGRVREARVELEACRHARRPPQVDPARLRADLDLARRGAEAGAAAPPPEWRFERRPIDDRGAWEGTVEAGVAEDSNPNLLSRDFDLAATTPDGKPVRGAQHDLLGNLGLRLGWYPLHGHGGCSCSLAAGLEAAQSLHRDFSYLDLGQVRGVVQLAAGQDPRGVLQGPLGGTRVPFGARRVSLLLQAAASYTTLNGAAYLRTGDGALSVRLAEAQAAATRLDLVFSGRSFAPAQPLADERRTGQDLSLGLAQTFYLGRGDRTLTLGARGIDRRAHPAYAARALAADALVELPLALRWSAVAEAEWRRDRFRSSASNLFSPFAGPPRRDTTRRGALALVWAAAPRWRWTLRGSYGERTSNVVVPLAGLPDLGYRRLVLGLGGSWSLR